MKENVVIATPELSPTNEREPYTQEQIVEIWFTHQHFKEKHEGQLAAMYPEADRELIEAAVFGGFMNMHRAAARCETIHTVMVCCFESYLWTCIWHKYIDLVKQEERLKVALSKLGETKPDPHLLHRRQAEREEARELAEFARNMLSDEDFELLRLRYLEGWTPKFIAEEAGVSASTVRRRISVILGRVRESYENRIKRLDQNGQVTSM